MRQLEIGDVIQRFDLGKEIGGLTVIESVTKTLGKSGHKRFKRILHYNRTMPSEEFIAEVDCLEGYGSQRYFLKK